MDGSLCDGQLVGPQGHEEIDVIDFAVATLHIDTGKVFVAAQAGEPIIMDLDQVEREILPVVRHMELLVGGFRYVAADEFLQSV